MAPDIIERLKASA